MNNVPMIGRPLSPLMQGVCALVESLGSSTVNDVAPHFPDKKIAALKSLLQRAVDWGLMTSSAPGVGRNHYSHYEVVPNWRAIGEARANMELGGINAFVKSSQWLGIASIFQYGAACANQVD